MLAVHNVRNIYIIRHKLLGVDVSALWVQYGEAMPDSKITLKWLID